MELTGLRWRDVDLASGRLEVGEAKTEAGIRQVDLSPALRDELAQHKAGSRFSARDDYVFATRKGTRLNRHNVRERIVKAAIKRANAELEKLGRPSVAQHVTTHSLRRTAISLMLEAGAPVPYVMRQVGHRDPTMTLGVYAQVIERQRDVGAKVDALVEWAQAGTNGPESDDVGIAAIASGHEETLP